jgi:hypothetical protein
MPLKGKEIKVKTKHAKFNTKGTKNILFCGLWIGVFLCALCVKLDFDLILNGF